MAETICPQCKATNSTTSHFCSECGSALARSAPATAAGAAGESTLAAGKLLQGRYRILAELGRGGFGAVYRAWDVSLDRPCAVKENLNTSPEAQRQFTREATVLANLSHPNLPRVTDHFYIPGEGQYLVMDFAEGQDLHSLVPRNKPLAVEQALTWIIQVMDALVYLHSRRPPVLHRDIKPANIRISPEGKAMLVDFGLVKMYDPSNQTTLGARAVTPGYAPPEQYGRGATDARSDLYAVGATLYRMLTGKEPTESVHRMTGETLRPVQELNPAVPPALNTIVERGMAIDPAQRYQSAADFKADLLQVQTALASGAPLPVILASSQVKPPGTAPGTAPASQPAHTAAASTAAPPAMTGGARRGGLRWLVVAGALAALLLLCGGGGLALFGSLSQVGRASQDSTDTLVAGRTESARRQSNATSQQATWTADASRYHLQQTATAALAEQATQLAQFTRAAGASATARARASATVMPSPTGESTPTPAVLPGWPTQFKDDFASNQNSWSTGVLAEDDGLFKLASAGLNKDVYRIQLDSLKPNAGWWTVKDAIATGDQFALQAVSRQTGGATDGWRGLVFHCMDNKNLYLFTISDSGLYSFWLLQDNKWQELIPSAPTGAILPGRWNEITVVANGSHYDFFINNILVNSYDDGSLSGGAGGLYFETGSNSTATYETNSLLYLAP